MTNPCTGPSRIRLFSLTLPGCTHRRPRMPLEPRRLQRCAMCMPMRSAVRLPLLPLSCVSSPHPDGRSHLMWNNNSACGTRGRNGHWWHSWATWCPIVLPCSLRTLASSSRASLMWCARSCLGRIEGASASARAPVDMCVSAHSCGCFRMRCVHDITRV